MDWPNDFLGRKPLCFDMNVEMLTTTSFFRVHLEIKQRDPKQHVMQQHNQTHVSILEQVLYQTKLDLISILV